MRLSYESGTVEATPKLQNAAVPQAKFSLIKKRMMQDCRSRHGDQ